MKGTSLTGNLNWSETLFGNEVMTPYQDPSHPEKLSALTAASMADLGYKVNGQAVDTSYQLPVVSVVGVDPALMVHG